MPRTARVIVPGLPHHIVQRGNRRMTTFFGDDDYRTYRGLLGESCRAARVEVVAYCLMPNHVHLVLIPQAPAGLRSAVATTHRRYATMINRRHGWTGHLWQSRFHSQALLEDHFLAAVRYVELNPVRARLVTAAWDWGWSSAAAHVAERADELVTGKLPPDFRFAGAWSEFLTEPDLAGATPASGHPPPPRRERAPRAEPHRIIAAAPRPFPSAPDRAS